MAALSEDAIFDVARQIVSRFARDAYLDLACDANKELRARIEELLDAHNSEDSRLDSPILQPTAPPADTFGPEEPGMQIGPYRLMEQIGEGGMGIVFVARQERPLRRDVALKVIRPGMDSKAVIARLEAERQALALMDHPGIAKVFDAGTTDSGRPYFVMELVRGIPITEYCDAHRLTVGERLELFVLVCQAVQHAHQKAVIHRDIKPSNVLVTELDGKPMPKVIDFGVAKALNCSLTDRTIYTNFQAFIGTPLYASPEQTAVSSVDVDTRSDVYSLGVLLYELLTGTTPFTREQLRVAAHDEIRRLLRDVEPAKPSTRVSQLGETLETVSRSRRSEPSRLEYVLRGDLDWIVMKSLEKDRARRYETAVGFADDIQRFLQHEPVTARPPSSIYRIRKYIARHTATTVAGGLVVLSLMIGLAVAALGWRKANALLAELRHELSRQAVTEVLSGNRDKSDSAIEKAAEYGVDSQRLRILRSLECLYGGAPIDARRIAGEILKNDPENMAARCIVTMANVEADNPGEVFRNQAVLRDPQQPPLSDGIGNLLLAQVMLYRDPEFAYKITGELTRNYRHWATIHAVHGAATIQHASDMSNYAQMLRRFEDGLESLRSAASMVPDNEYVVTEYLYGLMYAIELARYLDDERVDEWEAEAKRLIEQPRQSAWGGRRYERLKTYFIVLHGGGLTEEAWNRLENRGIVRDFLIKSLKLYGRQNTSVLGEVLDEYRDSYPIECRFVDTMARMDTVDDPQRLAMEVCDRFFSVGQNTTLEMNNIALSLYLLSGNVSGARAYAQAALKCEPGYESRWTLRVTEYLANPTLANKERLLEQVGPFSVPTGYTHSAIGMQALAEGKFTEARKYFESTLATGKVDWLSYCVSAALLERMKESGWPHWIRSTEE